MHTPGWNMRAMGESDRSPEFVLAREALILDVNGLLGRGRDLRDSDQPMPDGSTILKEPRISTTMLGRTSFNGLVSMAIEHSRGVSLSGDGVVTPLHFQSVSPDQLRGGHEVMNIVGSDPLDTHASDGVYSIARGQEIVASFKVSHLDDDHSEDSYFRYAVKGDGALQKAYIDDKGWNHASTAIGVADVEMANDAFGLVRKQLFPE